MASSVFFRFKSQREPTRVTFDGTGISVFELKREIIAISRLGDGTAFELTLYTPDTNEEYDDDTTIIPRSTTVIARRLPAAKPGKGGAARYVSGKMPVNAKNSHRSEPMKAGTSATSGPTTTTTNVSELQTEEERMAAVMQMGADQWQQQKAQMANATPVIRPGAKGKPANIPDHPPPAGYTCHRCLQKGHWIQACPTNDDPTFEGRPRIKRTTGIPKSFLRTVEKPTAGAEGSADEQKVPSGVMVNADGEYVVAEPDKASWEQYQAKANRSALARQEDAVGSKELQDRGLECSIDKRLFVDPVKTPCCQTTYCNDCITNTLLDENLQCPNCGEDGISIDDLKPDEETVSKIRSYTEEKSKKAKLDAEKAKSAQEKSKSPEAQEQSTSKEKTKSPSPSTRNLSPEQKTKREASGSPSSKKRKAEDELENDRKTPAATSDQATNDKAFSKTPPKGPKADAQKAPQFPPELAFMNQPPFTNGNMMPDMFNMPMNPAMNMAMMGNPMFNPMNPMMFNNMNGMDGANGQWNGMNAMNGMNGMNGGNTNMYNQPNNMYGMNGPRGNHMNGRGGFNQRNFNSRPANEDSPYFRQPVNPGRHQGRRNVQRPADYREI